MSSESVDVYQMARLRASLERRAGEGLRRLRDGELDPMDVGEVGVGSLARNWLGISASEASELARLADACDAYPLLAKRFLAGELCRGKVRELLRVLEPATERGWIAFALEVTVHDLRMVVRAFLRRRRGEHPEEDGEDHVEVAFRGSAWVGRLLRTVGRDLVEKVQGQKLPMWRVVEILCAEFASEFAHLYPDTPGVDEATGFDASEEVPGVPVPTEGELREQAARGERQISEATGVFEGGEGPDPGSAETIEALVSALRLLIARKQDLDYEAGQKLAKGKATCSRLGISERRGRVLRSLFWKVDGLADLAAAYRKGRLGWSKTWLLTRICSAETCGAWVRRAERVTLRRLENEIEAMEAFRDLNPAKYRERTGGGPPDDSLLREWKMLPGGYRVADWESLRKSADLRIDRGFRRGVPRGYRPQANRFRAPPGVERFFRATLVALETLLGTQEQAAGVLFLVEYFRAVYDEEARALMGKHRILTRDGFQCVFPGCSSRRVEAHHIEYRSRGGGDEPENLVSLCPAHHRAGQHAGRVGIRGQAPDALEFEAGGRLWREDRLVGYTLGSRARSSAG